MNQVRRFLAHHQLGVDFDEITGNNVDFSKASVIELCGWIESCDFLENRSLISTSLRQNYIDGKCFMLITEDEWINNLGLDLRSYLLLNVLKNKWNIAYTQICNKIVDNLPQINEDGGISYGEIVVLGYSSYFSMDGNYLPLGKANERFELKMKADNKKSYDCFQIGRLEEPFNDFSVKGPLRQTKTLATTSPVSRFACRILCQRHSPYKSFVYASGNDQQGRLAMGDCSFRVGEDDALTSFGIKLLNRNINEWYEISVNGNPYSRRTFCRSPGKALFDQQKYSNELEDGAIIDVSGCLLLFRKKVSTNDNRFAYKVMQSLTNLKATCPVSLSPLVFEFICAKDRERRALKYLRSSNSSYLPYMTYSERYSDVDNENNSVYCYTECGHVHAFHKMLENQPCSLCRRVGPFVQIKYNFCEQIDFGKPICIFNPCGHICSKQCALEYSMLKMPVIYDHDHADTPQCPFCLTHLKESNPFSKLIFQVENGKCWDDEEVEVDAKFEVDKNDSKTYIPRFMIPNKFHDKREISSVDNISSQIDHEDN